MPMPSNEARRNLLSNERLESFWDALWLELWPFLLLLLLLLWMCLVAKSVTVQLYLVADTKPTY